MPKRTVSISGLNFSERCLTQTVDENPYKSRKSLHPAALASMPYGVVLVRVRVQKSKKKVTLKTWNFDETVTRFLLINQLSTSVLSNSKTGFLRDAKHLSTGSGGEVLVTGIYCTCPPSSIFCQPSRTEAYCRVHRNLALYLPRFFFSLFRSPPPRWSSLHKSMGRNGKF